MREISGANYGTSIRTEEGGKKRAIRKEKKKAKFR